MSRPRSAALLWLFMGLGALPAVPGLASDAREPHQRELLLFEDVTISAAAKHEQSTREAPSAVTVITRDEIQRFGYRNLAEALRSVPGFYISNDRNYSLLGVRGFLIPGDYSDRILLLVNGHTYNDDVYQQALIGNEFGIDVEAIDRIEVIRGPGSALYGGNALFAVINVVTLTGAQSPGIKAVAEAGSFGRKRGQISIGHVTASGIDVFASGSVLDVDGQQNLFYPEFDSPETSDGVAHNADGERALNFYLSARYGPFSLQGGINRRQKHIPTASFGTTFDDNGTMTVDQRRFAEVRYDEQALRDVNVSARLFYDGLFYHGTYVLGSGADREKNEDYARSNWLGGEARARWNAPGRNVVTVGSEYAYHPSARQENFSTPGHVQFLDDKRTFGTWGVYLQDEFAATRTLMLVGGARYDQYYGKVAQFSPRAAILWRPYPTTGVKLLYGQAFRPPNLYEQYYAYQGDGVAFLANSDLDPERITTYEAVLEQEVGRVQGSVSAYHYIVKDLINQVEVGAEGGPSTVQFVNNASAHGNGLEFALRIPLPRQGTLRATYSLLEARNGQDHLLRNSPKHLGNIGATFPIAFGIEAGAELIIVGPRHTLEGRTLETAHILNLNLTYAAPIPGLRFALGLYNLLDHTYPDPAGAEHVQERIPQDGFTFRGQIEYGF